MKTTMKILTIAMVAWITGCSNSGGNGPVTAKVKAVEQVENYTYLLVKGKGPAYWIAVSSTDIGVGESITYEGGMLMENFYSKELDRTFEKVLFLDGVLGGTASAMGGMQSEMDGMQGATRGSDIPTDKLEISPEAAEGAISIAALYEDPSSYEGKMVRVRGQVAKYNPEIMERNWVHLQDGTEYDGKYDLTVTSLEPFEVGQVITVEGILAMNRDFGYGYEYELLLEKATQVK
jgi:hypothetical protein